MSSRGPDLRKEGHRSEPVGLVHDPHDVPLRARQVWLVVAESGTSDLVSAATPDARSPRVLLAQHAGELPMEFSARVIRCILGLERERREVGRTVLRFGPHWDADVAAARQSVARAIIAHTATVRGVPLEVVRDDPHESRDDGPRHQRRARPSVAP